MSATAISNDTKQELVKKVEGRLVSFHVISMLKMVLSKNTDDAAETTKETIEGARESAEEIVEIILQALHETPTLTETAA